MQIAFSCGVLILSTAMALSDHAQAEVTDSSPQGFAIQIETTIKADPQKVYRLLVENIGDWWEPSHTYSGDSKNLYLEAKPKGWFGERLGEGGFVQHMEVIYAAPGKMLRLRGALGPLQEHAVTGVMTWSLASAGPDTKLKLTYRVGGYMPRGLKALASPVENVISTQLVRLKRLAETGTAGEA